MRSRAEQVPSTVTALYRFFDKTGALLYIGISGAIPTRLGQHHDTKPWFHEVARVTVEHHPARPTALLVRLLDGHTVATTPRLDVVRAGMVADAAADLVGDPAPDREHGHLWPLTQPLPVEVRVGGGRHATVRFVRVRGE